jgi:hypothetical protein
MLTGSLKRTHRKGKGPMGTLKRRLNKVDDSLIYAGYFDSQGEHPTAGMSFVELIRIHELGLGFTEQRPMRHIVNKVKNGEIDAGIYRALTEYFTGKGYAANLMNRIGAEVNDLAYQVFGHSPPLQVTANPTPLVDTGELSDAFSWMSTLNGKIKSLPDRNKRTVAIVKRVRR